MLRGLYAAATGMEAATHAHEITSRNLAHVSVPGFRKALLSFETLNNPEARGDDAETHGTQTRPQHTDFSQGPLQQTGAPLDLAISGDGFFVVQGEFGPLYTRAGNFSINADREIVTPDGLAVSTRSGAIVVPEEFSASDLSIGADGSVFAGKDLLGKLDIVRFENPNLLQSAGSTLYQAPPQLVPQPSEAGVVQGAREMSNVSAVNELVNLIAAQRHYEMSQRAASTINHSMQKRIESN